MKCRIAIGLLALCLLLTACAEVPSPNPPENGTETPFVKAVWMPYMQVERLLVSGDTTACRAAIAAAMDDCVRRGVNTVYFHVRANSDAYYASGVYPPNPAAAPLLEAGFDPLTAAVEEAHARGLALHAWVNPYRIGTDPSRARTDAVFEAGGRYYYVPSAASTHELVLRGVRELVTGYAIDGVQFDDYFYPEGAVTASAPAAFEETDFRLYREGGGTDTVGAWRRRKVSALIAAVCAACHTRDGCVFGVSPAYDIDGNRDSKYADVEEWARTKGYVDYLCPQLYVGFAHEYVPFTAVLDRWTALPRDPSVTLVAGLALYKAGLAEDAYAGSGRTEWASRSDILSRQATLVQTSGWDGVALYSHLSFTAEDGRDEAIVNAEAEALRALWTE